MVYSDTRPPRQVPNPEAGAVTRTKGQGYNNHTNNGGHNNHIACGGNWGCWRWENAGYDNHSNGGYNNHSNTVQVDSYYNDHNDTTADYPRAHALKGGITPASTQKWVELKDAIDDLKNLRDAIQEISVTKVKKGGEKIDFDTAMEENSDKQFAPGRNARAAQINETITNIENLWGAINGTTLGLTPKTVGDKIAKQDYTDIITKAQELASVTQTPAANGYNNHTNTGARHYNSPAFTDGQGFGIGHGNSGAVYSNHNDVSVRP